jgi:hypothetical protein
VKVTGPGLTKNPNITSSIAALVPYDEDDEEEEHFLDRLITRRLGSGPEVRLKLLKWFWLISLATMLFGYAIMVLLLRLPNVYKKRPSPTHRNSALRTASVCSLRLGL